MDQDSALLFKIVFSLPLVFIAIQLLLHQGFIPFLLLGLTGKLLLDALFNYRVDKE